MEHGQLLVFQNCNGCSILRCVEFRVEWAEAKGFEGTKSFISDH